MPGCGLGYTGSIPVAALFQIFVGMYIIKLYIAFSGRGLSVEFLLWEQKRWVRFPPPRKSNVCCGTILFVQRERMLACRDPLA